MATGELVSMLLESDLEIIRRASALAARVDVLTWLVVKLARKLEKTELDVILADLSAGPEKMFRQSEDGVESNIADQELQADYARELLVNIRPQG